MNQKTSRTLLTIIAIGMIIVGLIGGFKNMSDSSMYTNRADSVSVNSKDKSYYESKVKVQEAMGSVNLYDYYEYKNAADEYESKTNERNNYRQMAEHYKTLSVVFFFVSVVGIVLIIIVNRKKEISVKQ